MVVALIAALAALYTVTAVVARRGGVWEPWVWPVLTTWAVLVWLAPSFAWCAFPPLFFLCTRAYPSRIAYPVVGVLAVPPTSVAFFTFSGRTEWAVLVGPLCTGGALIVMAYSQIERDGRERVRLLRQVAETRSRLAETEREAGVLAERERLAREIHDTVTQGLTSSLLRLEAAEQIWRRQIRGRRNGHVRTSAWRPERCARTWRKPAVSCTISRRPIWNPSHSTPHCSPPRVPTTRGRSSGSWALRSRFRRR